MPQHFSLHQVSTNATLLSPNNPNLPPVVLCLAIDRLARELYPRLLSQSLCFLLRCNPVFGGLFFQDERDAWTRKTTSSAVNSTTTGRLGAADLYTAAAAGQSFPSPCGSFSFDIHPSPPTPARCMLPSDPSTSLKSPRSSPG